MAQRKVPVWFHMFEALISWIVFFEVFYYMTHDGEALHDVAREKAQEAGEILREKANTVYALKRTREEILRLPETDMGNSSNDSNTH